MAYARRGCAMALESQDRVNAAARSCSCDPNMCMRYAVFDMFLFDLSRLGRLRVDTDTRKKDAQDQDA